MKTIRKKSLPKFLKKYFWDIDFEKLETEKYPYFVIEKILEYGDKKAVKWMAENYEKSQIKETLIKKKKHLSQKRQLLGADA